MNVTPATAELRALGATVQLTAEVRDQVGRAMPGTAVSWTSADPAVATVAASGLVTAVANGTVTVTATAGSASGSAAVTVMQSAGSVVVTPASATVGPRDTVRLSAEALDANGHAVAGAEFSWSSSDESVATVDAFGLVTGVAEGEATVTAAVDAVSGSAAVRVMSSVDSVVVTPPSATVAPGNMVRLSAEALDADGRPVAGASFSWSSSDVSVATVDASGLVTGVADGTATVTAAAGDARGVSEITVVNPDRAALVALYEATDGPNWLNNDGWLTDAPLGNWYGVDTGASGRVVRLDLAGEWDHQNRRWIRPGLRGTIPPEIVHLSALRVLDLSHNYLAGTIPPEVGNLANLEELELRANDLEGMIPPTIGRLSSLNRLDLGENDLRGPIPPELSGLTNLRRLELDTNALTGAVPPQLASLSNLWLLDLGNNELSGPVPSELGGLAKLTSLTLSANYLSGQIPPELGGLTELRHLNLQRNGLEGPIPRELGNLSNLGSLYLRSNKLTELSPGTFVGLTNLTTLDLRENPGSPFRLTLQAVRLDHEDLLAPGPANVAVRVAEGAPFPIRVPLSAQGADVSVDTLTIGTGSAQSTEAAVTRNAAGLAGARVYAGPAPAVPENMRGIEIAVADPIVMFPALAPTVSLSSDAASAPEGGTVVLEVVLSAPASSDVSFTYALGTDDDDATADADATDYSHGRTGSVRIDAGASSAEIEIAINDDHDIEPVREFFTVTLDPPGEGTGYILGLQGTASTAVATIEEGVCDRTSLIRDEIMAVVGSDDCAGTDGEDLASVEHLVVVGDAPWERSESSVLWTRELAARIRTGECDAENWAALPGAPADSGTCVAAGDEPAVPRSRRAPGTASNTVTTLREGDFADLPNLETLDLLRLGLTELPPGVFAGLRRLHWLSLQYNELTSLPAGIFSDITNLWNGLILANNRLASVPETVFAGLFPGPETTGRQAGSLLILEFNELTEVPPRVFAGLTGVDWLFLNGNRLIDLPSSVFSDLSGVTYLNLDRNRLRALPSGVFAGLSGTDFALSLQINDLADLPPGIFSDLPDLTFLGLNGNRLRSAEFLSESDLSGLTTLALSGNPLGTFGAPDLSGTPNLERLHISNIGLAELTPGMFSDLARLEELDLRNNELNELPAGAWLGLSRLKELRVDGNPGSPFPLTLELRRTDSDDPLAPGPATVGVALAQGAPLNITIPLSANGGGLSANAVTLRAGSDWSDEVTVTRPSGNRAATQVVVGPAPDLPRGVSGVELFVTDPLVLFASATNRAPVPERSMPLFRLRAGGESGSVDAASYFRDPDGDALSFTAASGRPDVASVEVSGGRVTVVPLVGGSAEVTVVATDPDGLSAQSLLRVGVRGASLGAYDIDLILMDEVSESIQAAFDDAVVYWSSILAGTELPDVQITGDFPLGCWDLTTSQTVPAVDELVIVASVREIDGRGGTLASAGYCGVREGKGGLPFMGAMQFDVDDLAWLEERGDMEEVILHEMGHVLGIGTMWRLNGLLVNPSLGVSGSPDTHFPGPLSIAAFDEAGGTAYTDGGKVPVENRAGVGSGDSHWRESVLDHELMTPFQNGGISDPLSAITIQSLADLGYTVDVDLAEPYLLPGAAAVADPARKIEYGDDILRGPIMVVGRDGRVRRVIPGDDP